MRHNLGYSSDPYSYLSNKKGHVPLLIFRKNSSLPAVFKAYPFIKFDKKKIQPIHLLEAYLLIKFSSFFIVFLFLS